MRYYNKTTRNEAIEGIHTIDDDCVVLDDSNVFWSKLPTGHRLVYTDDVPSGTEPIPTDEALVATSELVELYATKRTADINITTEYASVDAYVKVNDAEDLITVIEVAKILTKLDEDDAGSAPHTQVDYRVHDVNGDNIYVDVTALDLTTVYSLYVTRNGALATARKLDEIAIEDNDYTNTNIKSV
jgi:hypothetical protein